MKNCIYLITDTTNGMYYVGSHKDVANIEDKSYLGSGESIKEAVEAKGAENFNAIVLKTFKHRNDAFQGEKNLLEALNAAEDENCYNKSNNVFAPTESWFKKMFRKLEETGADEIEGFMKQIQDSVENTGNTNKSEGNDFNFESNLGLFLEKGFDAFSAEGERQGYDDPSSKNWEKQVLLLKVQLDNNINREYFIKTNKHSKLLAALDAADDIVSNMVEFKMKLKGAENELNFIEQQKLLILEDKGWYLMLHEALHDGFQDGSKKRLTELTKNI